MTPYTTWSINKDGGLCLHGRRAIRGRVLVVERTCPQQGLRCLLLHGLIIERGLCRVLLHSAHSHGRSRHACMKVVQGTASYRCLHLRLRGRRVRMRIHRPHLVVLVLHIVASLVMMMMIFTAVRDDLGRRFLSLAEAGQSIILGGSCIAFALALVVAYVSCAARAGHPARLLALATATRRFWLRARTLV